jgi:hypothetical protein
MGRTQRGASPGADDVVSGFSGREGIGGNEVLGLGGGGLRDRQQGDDWPYLRGGEMVEVGSMGGGGYDGCGCGSQCNGPGGLRRRGRY